MKRLLFLLVLVVPSQARAGLLFDQSPSLPGGYTAWTSSYVDSSFNYYYTLDNFKLSTGATVTGINWQGFYGRTDPSTGDAVNAAPNTTQWLFAIYTAGGSSNFPFTLVDYQFAPAASVTETFAGTTGFYNPGSGNTSTLDYYDESASLSGFTLQANQTYYLGIFSYNDGSGTSWAWTSSNTGDGSSYQYNTFGNETLTRALDRTFSLTGVVVPEPSSLALALTGLLVGYPLTARRRCRR